MSCNKYKNAHYKSAIQFYNTNIQGIALTNTVTNPLILALGTKVTDTGCALEFGTNGVDVTSTGLYRASADVVLESTVTGNLTVALTLNGVVMPETVRTIELNTGGIMEIEIETVRVIQTCCNLSDFVIGVIAYSDGTATANVNMVSGNVVKLA